MYKKDLNKNSIEKLFCEVYLTLPTRQLDKLETSIVLHLAKNEFKFNADPDPIMYMDLLIHKVLICPKDKDRQKYEEDLAELKKFYKYQYDVVTKRSKFYDFFINRAVRMMIAVTCHDLGEITQVLTMIQYHCFKNNDRGVRYETYSKMFPFGYATEEASDKLWYDNKVIDEKLNEFNLLDRLEYMESIRIKK